MKIEFARPYILIIIPIIVAGLFLAMRFLHTVDKKRRINQTIIRSFLFSILIFALSGVSVCINDDKSATIFIVDASDSLKNSRDDIIKFVNDAINEKKSDDYVGVVTFGRHASVENFLSEDTVFTGISSDIDSSSTNLYDAVTLGLSMIPDGYSKRLVIISDGNENGSSLLADTVPAITLSGCDIQTFTISEAIDKEVYVKNLDVPQSVGTGESFSIKVEIMSNVETDAVVSLYLGRDFKGKQLVHLLSGKNNCTFRDTQSDSGLKTYHVSIETPDDTFSLNNEYAAYTKISQKDPILILEGSTDEASELCKLFDSMEKDYECISSLDAPDDITKLTQYSAVILVDTYIDDLSQGFLGSIESYVNDYGKGLVACGGRHSYALGGWKDTPLETVLPVTMDVKGEKEIPKMAIQLVIDKSGSMSGENLRAAKQAAIAAAEMLRDDDYIGVMSFDDTYTRVVPITNLTDKKRISNAINSIEIQGGTSILPALRAAVNDLSACDATIKHIILLTDGQDNFEAVNYTPTINRANDELITISTVAIGEGCNTDLLSYIAEACGGRMYVTKLGTDIPKIFTQEVYLSANTYIVDNEFYPVYAGSPDESGLLSGLDNGFPSLFAYIATTIKPGRTHEELVSDQDDPVLAWWQCGLGKTVAWTSDVSGKWSGNLFSSEVNQTLWNNIISLVTGDVSVNGSYAEVTQNGDTATIHYKTDDFSSNTAVSATVTDADGNSSILTLTAVAPGEFEASFDMIKADVYSIAVNQYEGSELIGGTTTAAFKTYSEEYAFDFSNSGDILSEYARKTGGREITSPYEVFSGPTKNVKAMNDITFPLLIVALFVFILDIAYRRFNFRIFPEKLKVSVKESAKDLPPQDNAKPVQEGAEIKTDTVKVSETKHSSEKPSSKTKSKQQESDMLDASQLLNRMKKQ